MAVGRFSELGSQINYVIQLLLQSQNLMKLVKYDDPNPLSQPIVTNPSSLLFDRIFPIPKVPQAIETQKTIVTVTFSNAVLDNTEKMKDYKLIIAIISHIDIWRINGNIRPFVIANEIDSILNEKRGTRLTTGSVIFDSWIYREWNEKFCGYYLTYNLKNIN
jgi:hypothetical protein